MQIRTFTGSDGDMNSAIQEAEAGAQQLLDSLDRDELIGLKTQSFVDRFTELGEQHHTCFHIITVVYE
jgi:hypothetical protein